MPVCSGSKGWCRNIVTDLSGWPLAALYQGQEIQPIDGSVRLGNEHKAIRLSPMDHYFLSVIAASVLLLIVALALGTPGLKQAGSTDTVVPRTTRGLGFR